jgi:hypothetical protein
MASLETIERAVEQLSPDELARFHRWFFEFDAAAGKLDALAEKALAEYRDGKAREIRGISRRRGFGPVSISTRCRRSL